MRRHTLQHLYISRFRLIDATFLVRLYCGLKHGLKAREFRGLDWAWCRH